jgi:hypothetical protein
MSTNDITGDKLISKPSTTYADNWDRIFGKKEFFKEDVEERKKQANEHCIIYGNEKVEND